MIAAYDGLLLLPWAAHRFAPAMDLPNHTAAAAVLGQLAGLSEGMGALHYAAHGQWAPYHLAQGVLVPCVAWLGPTLGAKVFLGFGALLHAAALHWALARRGRSLEAHLAVGPLLFGASFFWGYLPMWIGTPGLIVAAAALAPPAVSRRDRWLAVGGSLWALSAHLLWLPALVGVWAVHGLQASHRRRVGFSVLALTALLVGPWLISALLDGGGVELGWGGAQQRVYQLKRLWAPFDRGWGRAAAWVLLGAMMLSALRARVGRPALGDERRLHNYGLALMVGGLALLAAFPLEVRVGSSFAWGISFRYAPLVWLGLALCAPPRESSPRIGRTIAAAAALVFAASLWAPWASFDRQANHLWTQLEQVPIDAAVEAPTLQLPFDDFWPAVDHHLPAWHVARGGAWANTIFAGGHAPIRPRGPPPTPTHRFDRTAGAVWSVTPVAAGSASP